MVVYVLERKVRKANFFRSCWIEDFEHVRSAQHMYTVGANCHCLVLTLHIVPLALLLNQWTVAFRRKLMAMITVFS